MFFVLASLAALTGSAAAADLARPLPQQYYKAPVAPLVYSWTGFYLGINGGGGFGRSAWDTTGNFDISGGVVGGTAGYNYQVGQAVFGVEADIDWADIKGSTSSAGCPFGCKTSDSWLGTVRGRLGYAADRFMPYITGGGAFGDVKAETPGFSSSDDRAGWTVGAGLEFAIAQNWTAKAEYLYVDLGKFNCGASCGGPATNNVSFTTNLVRAGVNYRF
jgi:outer membrane immunogenic protein